MNQPTDNTASALKTQSKKCLRDFFKRTSIKKLVGVLVPSILATILFPVFGAAGAGATASLSLNHHQKRLKGPRPLLERRNHRQAPQTTYRQNV